MNDHESRALNLANSAIDRLQELLFEKQDVLNILYAAISARVTDEQTYINGIKEGRRQLAIEIKEIYKNAD